MNMLGTLTLWGGMTLAMTACGKKGPLVYPDMLVPKAPEYATAIQIGSGVKIIFDLPTSDRAGNRLNNLGGLKISKRESDLDLEQLCSSCMNDYHLFRKLYLDLLPEATERSGNHMTVLDGDVKPGLLYSYVVVPFTKEGVEGESSPQMSVKLFQAVLPPILHIEAQPTEIKISFVSPAPVDGVLIGYNLYRTSGENPFSYLPINKTPLNLKEFVDKGLARGVKYRYLARAVVRLSSGTIVESLVSNVIEVMLNDD